MVKRQPPCTPHHTFLPLATLFLLPPVCLGFLRLPACLIEKGVTPSNPGVEGRGKEEIFIYAPVRDPFVRARHTDRQTDKDREE